MRILRTLISILSVLTTSCTPSASPPARPAPVPDAATWAGGPDGGAWILCGLRPESTTRFECTVYNDFTGEIWAKGDFELRQTASAEAAAQLGVPAVVPNPLVFTGFDGSSIYLERSLILLPDGELDFPLGRGVGKRQRFKLGEAVGPEVGYGRPAA